MRIGRHGLKRPNEVAAQRLNLFAAQLRCVVAQLQPDLRARRLEREIDCEGVVCIRNTIEPQNFKAADILQLFVNMKVHEVEKDFEQRRIIPGVLLHLRHRIAAEGQRLMFSLECLPHQFQPRAAREAAPKWQRVKEEAQHSFAICCFWPAVRCDTVAAMILATAGHVTPGATNNDDVDTTLLLDADLAILGAEPAAYQSYVNGVRAEYSHVDDAAWLVGRSTVLHRFLERPRLFATQYMHDTYEHRARANIQAELASLRRDG